MSLEEKSTDGMTGKESVKKFQSGDLEKHQDSYNGYGYGSSSLQNTTEKSIRKESKDVNLPKKVKK